MSIQNYRDLIAWQKSMDLVEAIYRAVANFPNDERFCLSQQLRRAAVSIPSNIAEGHARRSTLDFRRFLHIAYASRAEVETQIMIACRLRFLENSKRDELLAAAEEVGRLINGLSNSLKDDK